jgi:hypothetical protein
MTAPGCGATTVDLPRLLGGVGTVRRLGCRRHLDLSIVSPIFGRRVVQRAGSAIERGQCSNRPGSHFGGNGRYNYCLRDVTPGEPVTVSWSSSGYDRIALPPFYVTRRDVDGGRVLTLNPRPDVRFLVLLIRGGVARNGTVNAMLRLNGAVPYDGPIPKRRLDGATPYDGSNPGGVDLPLTASGLTIHRIDETNSGSEFTVAVVPADGLRVAASPILARGVRRLSASQAYLTRFAVSREALPSALPATPAIDLTLEPRPIDFLPRPPPLKPARFR